MQRWEYWWGRIWRISVLKSGKWSTHYELKVGNDTLMGQDVWDYVDKLGEAGWELVSVVPEIQTHAGGGTFTDGYMLWFKRPVE